MKKIKWVKEGRIFRADNNWAIAEGFFEKHYTLWIKANMIGTFKKLSTAKKVAELIYNG